MKGVVTSGTWPGGETVDSVVPEFDAVGRLIAAMPATRGGGAFSTHVYHVARLPTGHPRVGDPEPPGREVARTSQTFVRPSSAAWLVGGLLVRVSTVSWRGGTTVPGVGDLYSRDPYTYPYLSISSS